MFIDENTSRTELEQIAVQDLGIGLDMIAPMTTAGLLQFVQDWIEAGDECGECA